jgi:hypothetical protein
MTTPTPTSAVTPRSKPPGRRYWKITQALIFLHTLVDGVAFGLGFAMSAWDTIRGEWSQFRNLAPAYIFVSLVAWFVPLLMTVSNGFALYIVSKRSKGQSRPRITISYLLAVAALLSVYLGTLLSTFRGQGSPFLGTALWLAGPAILIFTGIILFRIPMTRPGHCPRCDYNLTGNTSGTCPECGNPIPATI